MNGQFLNKLTQMGVLHHLEEVMSLPPPHSLLESPAGMWRLLPHLWCTEERRAQISPSTVSVSTLPSRPKMNRLPLFFFFFFLTLVFAFFCLKFDWDGCYCLFDVVCVGPSRVRCGVWVTLLMILKPGGWRSIQTHFWLLPLRIYSYDSDLTMLCVLL